ncbi:hypothetical protein, partial [Candidatus Thiosymbion oneisti]|uniref:hypothetical protein n=1 Tax=Candidatus Thiosymbion oneisti TaxID=589554 RepID=UPI001C403FE6
LAGNPGPSVPPAPRRRRFPLAATPLLGTDTLPHPKRRQDGATWPIPGLCLGLEVPVSIGVKWPPHSKTSGGTLP